MRRSQKRIGLLLVWLIPVLMMLMSLPVFPAGVAEAMPASGGWLIETVDGSCSTFPSLALDSTGSPCVAYDQKYARKSAAGSWSAESIPSPNGNGGYFSLALDSSNLPHVTYNYCSSTPFTIDYSWKTSPTAWQSRVASGNYIAINDSSVAIDKNGYPHIGYFASEPGGYYYVHAWQDGSGWHYENIVPVQLAFQTSDSTATCNYDGSLALDNSGNAGNPGLVYLDYYDGALMYTHKSSNSGSWSTPEKVDSIPQKSNGWNDGFTIERPCLAYNGTNPCIAYYEEISSSSNEQESQGCLKYACKPGNSGWQPQTVDSSSSRIGLYASLALDASGNPYVSYYDGINQHLRFAHEDNTGWHTQTIDSQTPGGYGTSIAVNQSTGCPSIVYRTIAGALRLASFVLAPTVTGVNPNTGPTTGGTTVTITGTNLTGATAVMFGTVAATSFTVNSDTSITAVAPAESAGTVDVTVTTPGGTSATSSADQYTYYYEQPPGVESFPILTATPSYFEQC
jgi:hypothetical protein